MILIARETDWFQKGLEATEPKEQIEFFTKSIEQGNSLSESYYSRASAKLEQGDIQGAIDDYTKCIELDSNDDMAKSSEIYWAFQNSFMNTSTGVNIKKENYPCSIACFKKALKRFPDNPSAYGRLGYCYLAMEDDSLANEALTTMLAKWE